jgi:hypothetical protein
VKLAALAVLASGAVALAGCGFAVQSPDDFVLTRTGEGRAITLVVNDGGTIRCNAGHQKPISDALLIEARDLAVNLDKDAKRKLTIPTGTNSVYTYTIAMQDGTISFPDTAARRHGELAGAEQFVLKALAGPCAGAG